MEQKKNQFSVRQKKTEVFDKRLIKSIVKSVEEGLPRKEAVAIYGMSAVTLAGWMKTYGQQIIIPGNGKYTPPPKDGAYCELLNQE